VTKGVGDLSNRLVDRLATTAGHGLRFLRGTFAGLAGAALVSVGVGLYDGRAGLIIAGLFCLALDRRVA
jgi:hypothetical protein